jgi:hypothetical protein
MFSKVIGNIKTKIITRLWYHLIILWSMPFDYNMNRIKHQPIFVHEEMRLPKSWKGFGDSTRFNATVNGQPLSGRSLAIDPFSFPDAMVVHYLVQKNDIIKLIEKVGFNTSSLSNAAAGSVKTNGTGLMKFTLSPLSATTQSVTVPEFPGFLGASLMMTLIIGTILLVRPRKRILPRQ